MNILILENQLQDLNSTNCGEFQLYFCKNLFDPNEKSKILNHRTLNKNTLQTIMNKIFSTDIKENEYILKNFKEEYNLWNLLFSEIKKCNFYFLTINFSFFLNFLFP